MPTSRARSRRWRRGRAVAAEDRSGSRTPATSVDHYAAIFEFSDDAILTKDLDATITSWNPGAERIYGYTAEEAVGRPVSLLVPEHRAGEERRILRQLLAGERVDHYETERVTKDGRLITVSLTVSPIRDETGVVTSASAIARDVTAQRRSLVLADRLQQLTTALGREITPERTVSVLLEQAVAGLGADAGTVGLVDEARDEVELLGAVGHDIDRLSQWNCFPLDSETPMSHAIHTAEPIWIRTGHQLLAEFPALAGSRVLFEGLAVIPLTLEGKSLGALSLSFSEPRELDAPERSFLLAMALHAAYALERAGLYEQQRIAVERLSFLAQASELLGSSLDPDAALRSLADLAVGRIADWCAVDVIDESGRPRSVAVAHVDPERVDLAHRLRENYPPDPHAPAGVANVIRTGRSELYGEIPDELLAEQAVDDEHLRQIRELGLVSAMVVPLAARGRVLGALSLISAESGRRYDARDLELAEDLARRAALAIDNSILFHREHEAAVTLQRALLPQAIPEIAGLDFAFRYEPAAAGLEVGGDWYDVVEREDGTVALTIADVAGRGIGAASVMGRLRPALRALATAAGPPATAIAHLDTLMRSFPQPVMATVLHVHFDPRTGEAEYVRAGHPPALLRLPDGRIEELGGGGTPPLGLLDDIEYRTHRISVPAGSLLLLYTDGLIERPDGHLRADLERLSSVFATVSGEAEECLDQLAGEFAAGDIFDDVAMLAMAVE